MLCCQVEKQQMKAILNNDIIVTLNETAPEAVEIGSKPKGVGMERLRFDGNQVVDLADLSQIWVKHLGGNHFELHCVEAPGCQLVDMTYADRRNLIIDNNVVRVKTALEIDNERLQGENLLLKNQLRQRLKAHLGDLDDQIADLGKLVYSMLVYQQTSNVALGQMLGQIGNIAKDVYTKDQIEAALTNTATTLKTEMPAYYAKKR